MVKHLIELVVKYGEFAVFQDATMNYQKVAADHGVEPYTLWINQGSGRMNEAFFEATFDSEDALMQRDVADGDIPELGAALTALLSHCVPGSIFDRRLSLS